MARKSRHQQKRDARRIARGGTGNLDARSAAPAPSRRPRDTATAPSPDDLRARLLAERQHAIDELARLGLSPQRDESAGSGESPFEEGDVAQASERTDMSFMHRERLADRINRLTRALERLARGEHGVCEECGRAIEPARLAAMPEVTLCRECQERIERRHRAA